MSNPREKLKKKMQLLLNKQCELKIPFSRIKFINEPIQQTKLIRKQKPNELKDSCSCSKNAKKKCENWLWSCVVSSENYVIDMAKTSIRRLRVNLTRSTSRVTRSKSPEHHHRAARVHRPMINREAKAITTRNRRRVSVDRRWNTAADREVEAEVQVGNKRVVIQDPARGIIVVNLHTTSQNPFLSQTIFRVVLLHENFMKFVEVFLSYFPLSLSNTFLRESIE